MKKSQIIFSFFILIFLTAFSCHKDDSVPSLDSQILGQWNWLKSIGGITGQIESSPESTGASRRLIFLRNNIVYVIQN